MSDPSPPVLRYVSRYHVKDSARHVVLGTQQFKPNEFASQINLSMENAWGILRCVIDICRALDEGKYLILKDPNKVRDPSGRRGPQGPRLSPSPLCVVLLSQTLTLSFLLSPQQVIRVYSLPDGTFSSDEDEEDDDDEEDEEEEGESTKSHVPGPSRGEKTGPTQDCRTGSGDSG